MLKRTLFFSTPMCLSLKDRQLVFNTKQMPSEQRRVPIEDLAFVVLEHPMINITLPLLGALTDNNVGVVFCNSKQMPSGLLLNLDSNNIQGELYRAQAKASEPLCKNLWKQTVEAKIKNQAQLLTKLGLNGDLLKPYYTNVKSGDTDNREGLAAKLYWKTLFGKDFIRSREGESPNNLLNYGYTILRAATARSLMGSGLLPAFGIFHKNRYNAFPLADDIMEPYRPYIDELVYELYYSGYTELDKEVKSKLVMCLYGDTHFSKIRRPLDIALTISSSSLAQCFAGNKKLISYPTLK